MPHRYWDTLESGASAPELFKLLLRFLLCLLEKHSHSKVFKVVLNPDYIQRAVAGFICKDCAAMTIRR
jgi:hypothetical protein